MIIYILISRNITIITPSELKLKKTTKFVCLNIRKISKHQKQKAKQRTEKILLPYVNFYVS